jgi:hypothetical protein
MMRRLVAGVVVFAVTMVATPAALASGGRPVLGWSHAFLNSKGFGAAEPQTVFLGGDPTGEVSKLRWQHWGGRRSIGFGRGWCPGRSVASGHYCTASLHLYDLANCHGLRAYRMMVFYFKPSPRRHWIVGAKLNICDGRYVF